MYYSTYVQTKETPYPLGTLQYVGTTMAQAKILCQIIGTNFIPVSTSALNSQSPFVSERCSLVWGDYPRRVAAESREAPEAFSLWHPTLLVQWDIECATSEICIFMGVCR